MEKLAFRGLAPIAALDMALVFVVQVVANETGGLAFTVGRANTTAGATISSGVRVEVQDSSGNRVATANDGITLRMGNNPSGGASSGTVTVRAVNGVATFSDLSIDKAGVGYRLVASSASLTGSAGGAFDITAATASMPTGISVRDLVQPRRRPS